MVGRGRDHEPRFVNPALAFCSAVVGQLITGFVVVSHKPLIDTTEALHYSEQSPTHQHHAISRAERVSY